MWNLLLLVIFSRLTQIFGQFPNCDYYQELEFEASYLVLSPGFYNNYPPNTKCRYASIAPVGHQINLFCSDFDVPRSPNCLMDRMEVSMTGRSDLADAQRYCGSGKINITSDENALVFALKASKLSRGGKFVCTLTIVPAECDCGKKKTSRIVGGVETIVNEFPMMAGLVDLNARQVMCGATIISKKHAVTAAHCLTNRQPNEIALLVGDHSLNLGSETPFAKLYLLSDLIINEEYTAKPSHNDIALVQTENFIEYNEGVGPVCLPWRFVGNTFEDKYIEACGWGTLEFGGPVSNNLMKVSLQVISNANCSRKLANIIPSQICTYTPEKDTCQFDSGGPLFYTYPTNGLVYNVGLASYGVACATTTPSVNTRITEYLDWIKANTPSTFYCYK